MLNNQRDIKEYLLNDNYKSAMKKFETKYGYFTEDGNEYVIKTYLTPKPWVNVISNGDYGLVISQAGGGFSWLTHSEYNRLNRWHQDLIQDNWGKYFYVKDNNTNEIWSPAWMPVKTELDFYECRHGFGYTSFESEYKGVKILLTVFVPVSDQMEIWNFRVENKSSEQKSLSIFTYFEWCLGSSADHHREFHKTFIETEFDAKLNSIIATKRLWEIPLGDRGHWNVEYPYIGYISSNKKITDYEGDKEAFIGKYGSVEKPVGIISEKLSKKTGKWTDPIGTIRIDCNLSDNSSDCFSVFLGISESKSDISLALNKFQQQEQVDDALVEVRNSWFKMFDPMVIDTPDKAMNILVNKWLRYQAVSGRLWGRTAYYQQSGAYGFRDQLQDSLVFLPIDSSLTEKQIRLHARHQKEDGTVLHWWHPITETGLETEMTDDLLWLPFVILQYLDETNNYEILLIKEPYYDKPGKKDSLFHHCIASIEKVLSRFSERGLPLIGAGDWNDGLSAVGLDMKGESIWLAEFFYLILRDFSFVCEKIGEEKFTERYILKAKELKKAFDNYAWDGEWFFRATKDNGEKIGSRENDEGRIFLNAQIWAVIGEIADKQKQNKAMESVAKYLLKKNGPLLLSPAYTKPDKMIGYLSRYAPGRRENGGVYTHAATWAIWAYSKLRMSELAFDVYKKLSPVYNGLNPDEYIAEPYVTPGNIDGPDSPNYGMGGWTWYTGSASWFQKIIVDWILGIRATPEGLIIDPCIPKEWDGFSIKRTFMGTEYNIKVFNEEHVTAGIKYILVDNEKLERNILNIKSKASVDIQVYMGSNV
jgi:cellobiose phosphorylase